MNHFYFHHAVQRHDQQTGVKPEDNAHATRFFRLKHKSTQCLCSLQILSFFFARVLIRHRFVPKHLGTGRISPWSLYAEAWLLNRRTRQLYGSPVLYSGLEGWTILMILIAEAAHPGDRYMV
jgi:hypothetical protein